MLAPGLTSRMALVARSVTKTHGPAPDVPAASGLLDANATYLPSPEIDGKPAPGAELGLPLTKFACGEPTCQATTSRSSTTVVADALPASTAVMTLPSSEMSRP